MTSRKGYEKIDMNKINIDFEEYETTSALSIVVAKDLEIDLKNKESELYFWVESRTDPLLESESGTLLVASERTISLKLFISSKNM